ncbi:MAG TPA: hypothetical protein VJ761_15460 [Ktedonobacteraceae bacterium]|nr:hypothetical protein [Ktedonobacteraceae bacterium]
MNLNLSVIVRALLRWSWVLVLFLIVGYGLGKVLTSVLPPQYQAASIVQLSGTSRSNLVQPITVYSNLINSDAILGTALKNYPNLNPQSIGTKNLVINPDDKSNSVSIQVTLSNAKEAAGLANDLAQLLVTTQNAAIQQAYAAQLQIVNARIANETKTIDTLYAKLVQLTNVPNGPTVNAVQIQQVNSSIQQEQNLESADTNQQTQLTTDQKLDSTPLFIVQKAIVPTKPSGITGVIPLSPLAIGVMFILALVSIFFLERMMKRVNSVYGLQKVLVLPVLGSLRWASPGPATVPLKKIIESKGAYAEDARVMMADVLFHAEDARASVLAITARKPKSGISSVASELAALLAQSKRRVLLIDANLHDPVQHKRLGVPNDAGLAKMLEELRNMKVSLNAGAAQEPVELQQQAAISMMETRRVAGVTPGQSSSAKIHQQRYSANSNGASGNAIDISDKFPFDSYIVSTNIQNLYALPAGKSSINASSLLSMPEMEQFLHWASKPIDFVIIDCPSLTYAEAHVLGGLSDQTFLVVDASKDRMKQLENVKEDLITTGVRLSGLIVNKLGRWI